MARSGVVELDPPKPLKVAFRAVFWNPPSEIATFPRAAIDQLLTSQVRHRNLPQGDIDLLSGVTTVARCVTLGRSQDVCKGSRFNVEDEWW